MNSLRHYWQQRIVLTPERWELQFGVHLRGRVIGLQTLEATDFPTLRTVATGSWLGLGYQGDGVGTEMRAAVLQFAFDSLYAERALSAAYLDNPASRAVSAKLGYRPNGIDWKVRLGKPAANQRLQVTAAEFVRPDWRVVVDGLESCLPLLVGR